jgi:hypothetical protein
LDTLNDLPNIIGKSREYQQSSYVNEDKVEYVNSNDEYILRVLNRYREKLKLMRLIEDAEAEGYEEDFDPIQHLKKLRQNYRAEEDKTA